MALEVSNSGNGFIGQIGADWSITQNGSPAIIGQSSGRLGGLSFSAGCDDTTMFTIDDYLTVKHYFDSGDRWLSSFDGYIRGVTVNPGFAQFSMVSKLSALDVERQTSANISGVYQRAMNLPATAYTISGTPYVTPENPLIYDMSSGDDSYMFILAQGGHSGEVVFVMGVDGYLYSVWPVYSDATDLADPQARIISYSNGAVLIGQTGAKRVKRFSASSGSFTSQFGAAGSADGQFQSIVGIAWNSAWNSIFVSDSVLGRIQRFNYSGVYQNKWGTSGTGSGDTVFDNLNRIAVTKTGDHVYASDYNARIREYDSFGNLQGTPFGGYDFGVARTTREFVLDAPIKLEFDSHGSAYAIQNGTIFKYTNTGLGSFNDWPDGLNAVNPNQSWETGTTGTSMGITSSGIIHVGRTSRVVEQYSGSAGSLKAYILYVVGLAVSNFKVRLLALNDPFPLPEYIAWRGNVWAQLCDLMAVTKNSMYAYDDALYFENSVADSFVLPEDTTVIPIEIDSRATGRSVQVTNQATVWVTGVDAVLYDAEADNNRTFSVDVGDLTFVTVSQNTYPEYIFSLTPVSAYPIQTGQYLVTDTNGLTVTPTLWTNYGGSVRAQEGANPGDISVTITGPGVEIPGFESPYKIGTVGGQAALKINGVGVRSVPEVVNIGTGVPEEIANQEIAQRIDSFAVTDLATAYSVGSWAAYNSGTPNQRVQVRMRLDKAPVYFQSQSGINGISLLIGNLIRVRDALYIIEDLSYNQAGFTLGCYRYTESGVPSASILDAPRFEEIWAGRSAGEFDAFWSGYTAQDLTMAPLRNPYGV